MADKETSRRYRKGLTDLRQRTTVRVGDFFRTVEQFAAETQSTATVADVLADAEYGRGLRQGAAVGGMTRGASFDDRNAEWCRRAEVYRQRGHTSTAWIAARVRKDIDEELRRAKRADDEDAVKQLQILFKSVETIRKVIAVKKLGK